MCASRVFAMEVFLVKMKSNVEFNHGFIESFSTAGICCIKYNIVLSSIYVTRAMSTSL